MPTVFHVGLMKTGSTALQDRFFPHLPDCALVTHRSHPLFKPVLWSILFSEEGEFLPATVRQFLEDLRRERPILLLSQEALSWCHEGGRTARRLHAIDPGGRVVMVVRSQRTILRSIYHQYLQNGGTRSVRGWLASGDFDARQLRYDDVVADYQTLFGRDRVGVLLHEQLLADPGGFLARLSDLIGSEGPAPGAVTLGRDSNRSFARPTLWVNRRLNQVSRVVGEGAFTPVFPELWPRGKQHGSPFRKRGLVVLGALDRRLPTDRLRRAGAADRRAIEGVALACAEGNARLEALTGLSLRPYGYPLPA